MNKETNQHRTSYTLTSWLNEWLVTYKQCSVKKSTYKKYCCVGLLVGLNAESKIPLQKITGSDLQKILNYLYKQKYSKSTITKVRYTLQQCFSAAVRLHYLGDNPSECLMLPDAPTKNIAAMRRLSK